MNLGVAVLGTGRLGGRYIDIVKEADGVDMKAVAEPREEQVAPLKMSHPDVDFVADYRELLDRDDIHIVIGTLPHWLHKEAAIDAAMRGKHIYLEKPVATAPEDVDAMQAACDEASVMCVVAHPWRGHPPIQRVAIPLIKSGRIGEPRLVRVFGKDGEHGGDEMFLDLYPHFFDFLWQAFGVPQWCQAHLTQDGRTCERSDLRPGWEGMGLVAGNGLKAYYCFEGGVAADVGSR